MNFLKNMSLKSKWIALICVAITLAVSITVIFSQWTARDILNDENEKTSSINAQNAMQQVSLGLEGYEKSLAQLQQVIETMVDKDKVDFKQIDQLTKKMTEENDDYISVYYMDFEASKFHGVPEVPDWDVNNSRAPELVSKNPEVQWLDVYLDTNINVLMTSVIAPVYKDDKIIGSVGFDLDFSTIGHIRESIEKESTSKLMIVDPNGLVVSSFIEDSDGKNLNEKNSGQIDGVTDLMNKNELDKNFEWLTKFNGTSKAVEEFTWDGVDYTGEIKTLDRNGWKIVSLVDSNEYAAKIQKFTNVGWISIVIGLIIGCLFAIYLARKLVGIFANIKKVFQNTSSGDFKSRFETNSNDEIGDLANHYNKMLDAVSSLILQVNENEKAIRNSSNSLAVIAKENERALNDVSNSVEQIAENTSTQAEKVQDSTTAIHVLATGIESIESKSQQMVDDAKEALVEVNSSMEKVQQLEHSYANLENAFSEVSNVTSNLDEKTKSISQVTNAISKITEQTNLLALNASIEAARAGEHGKGFAVVAEEVRKLAESSKSATADIQQIIVSILEDTQQLVEVMKQTNDISENQKVAVESVDEAIKQLSNTLENMKESISNTLENVSSMQQQKNIVLTSIETVNEMTSAVTAETQEIASSIEEQTSATSEVTVHATHLNEQVESLTDSVSKFKL
ncbi:MAG: methyl-accepting chemotaxis protein [Kurthia sp.]|nr:methyl-accepting chemotaxis protein [Candidatus Kurthia equi]